MHADGTKSMRSDAQGNRSRILRAAAEAFAEEGLGVSLIEIARRAGVGNATLHRNFNKEQLVDELFSDWFARRLATAERALQDSDPWHGFATFCEEMLTDGASRYSPGELFAIRPQWRERFASLMGDLLVRVKEAGEVRLDLTTEDLILNLISIAGTMTITAAVAPHQWRRQLQILLDGMRTRGNEHLPGFAVTPNDLRDQLARWSCQALRTN